MPYGISKEHGGDSPENVSKLKECMAKVGRDNSHFDEESLIRICKDQLWGNPKSGQKQGGM